MTASREPTGVNKTVWCNARFLRRNDTNPAGLPRAGLPPNHNLDILVERRQQIHQAFDRKARQLVVAEGGDLRLRQSQHLGRLGLRERACVHHLIERIGEAQLRITFGGIGKANVYRACTSSSAYSNHTATL